MEQGATRAAPHHRCVCHAADMHDITFAVFSENCVFANGEMLDGNVDFHRGGEPARTLPPALLLALVAAVAGGAGAALRPAVHRLPVQGPTTTWPVTSTSARARVPSTVVATLYAARTQVGLWLPAVAVACWVRHAS